MKRYLKTITAVVLAALTTAACQKENFGDATPAGQEVDVTLDLLAPQIGTKSYGDGTTAKTVYVHVYQQDANGLTYIQPAAEGEGLKTPSQSLTLSGLKATYSTRLVTGQTYTFVFWAQADNAPYTYDTNAKTITVDYTSAKGNDESRDAFYNVLPNVKIEGAYTASVQLTRPFAQLNFGVTSEDYAAAKAAGLEVTAAQVKLTNAATSLNLLDGSVSGAEDVTFAAAALPTETLSAAGATYKYVAMDYVLVGKSAKTLSEVTLTLTANGVQSATPEFTYSNVPLQANYRTNIVGNLFTSPAEVNITIDPAFDTPAHNVYPELLAVAANGGSITLSEDVELSEPLVIAAGKDAVINLNGKTIKNSSTGIAIMVNGDLTIDGDGNVDGGKSGNNQAVHVKSGAKVTINGGNFSVGPDANGLGNSCIETSGGDIVINGGHFESEAAYHGWYYVLNQNNSNPGTITVTGGTFVNYDPSTGDDYLGGNFVADGYASITASASPLTYKVEKVTSTQSTADGLASAMTVANSVNVVNQSIALPSVYLSSKSNTRLIVDSQGEISPAETFRADVTDVIFVSSKTLTLDGKGKIYGPSNSTSGFGSQAIMIQGGKVDIYGNLTIDGGSGSVANRALKITDGTANIYSGYFHAGLDKNGKSSELIFLNPAFRKYAYCNIYGGVFECDGDASYLINCYKSSYENGHAKVNIYGGTFVGFNPADNTAEGEHTNFVAPGYRSVETTYNGKQAWTVVAE